jgi:serine/threonine protein kinase
VNGTYAGFTVSLLYLLCDELSAGEGGFGHVVLCKNKLDGRRYAMKKILLKDKTLSQNNKILRLRHHLYSMLAVKEIECVDFSEANDVCRAIQSPIVFNCV